MEWNEQLEKCTAATMCIFKMEKKKPIDCSALTTLRHTTLTHHTSKFVVKL